MVVSIDGMMPDAYLDPGAHGLAILTLRSLVARGAAARVRGVMPTVTYPSHTTMVTGVPPRIHGVVANKPLDRLGKNLDGWYWYAEDIAVPTLYQAVEAQHRTAALIVWPVTVAAHASIVVPAIAELGPAVARRIEHDEPVTLGGDPHASFALVAAPGHGFSDKRTGELIAQTPPHGNHGWPPSDPAMAASLIAFGPAVPHVSLGTIDMVDIAPTIARWLGVALPSATGHPIEALAPGVSR